MAAGEPNTQLRRPVLATWTRAPGTPLPGPGSRLAILNSRTQ